MIGRTRQSTAATVVATAALLLMSATAGNAHEAFWETDISSFGGCDFVMEYGHELESGVHVAEARTISTGTEENPCLDQIGVRLWYHDRDTWDVYVTPWKYSTTNWVRVYRTHWARYHGSKHFVAKNSQTAVVTRP